MPNIFIAYPVSLTFTYMFVSLSCPPCQIVKMVTFLAEVLKRPHRPIPKTGGKETEREGNRGIEVGLGFTLTGLCLKAA